MSPIFRKKVAEALQGKALKGVHTNTGYAQMWINKSNQQSIYQASWNGSQDNGVHFRGLQVLDAASQLWHGKQPTIDQLSDVGGQNFNIQYGIVKVVNSYVTWTLANESHKTFFITIYECMYKSNRVGSEVTSALAYWRKCAAEDVAAGISKDGANAYEVIGAYTPEKLGATPGQTSGFSKMFKYTTRKVILEPGQRFVHTIQGPKDTTYDFSKSYVNNVYADMLGNKSVSVFAVVHSDLVTNINGGSGRYAAPILAGAESGGHLVATEVKAHYILELPEQSGIRLPTTTTGNPFVDLAYHRRAYLDNVWTYGPDAPLTDQHKIDPNQPATDI